MLDWTDRHQRYFMRLCAPEALLYTEMITTGALLHGDQTSFLAHHKHENPLAIQLGGSDPQAMARFAKIARTAGYDEVNINVGCPSDRVKQGTFGACLMASPQIVADCVQAMADEVDIPVSVKTRIGIDNQDSYDELTTFIDTVSAAGCDYFIIHARKAWLNGLSPKENREIPPLKYETVYQLKKDFPDLKIVINGGIETRQDIQQHLTHVDGVMIGRHAYHNPYSIVEIHRALYPDIITASSRTEIVQAMKPYIENELSNGVRLHQITRHMLGLFHSQPGARTWRRVLSEYANKPGAGLEILDKALQAVENI